MKKYLFILITIAIWSGISCKKKHTIPSVPAPSWETDQTGKYPLTMTAVVQVPENIRPYIQQTDEMGVFVGDECRGTGTWVHDGSISAFFILIHGTSSEESKLSFRYWNAFHSNLYSTEAFLDFRVDESYGTADAPQVLELKPVMHK